MATYWILVAPDKLQERLPSREDATEAAKVYLRETPAPAKVTVMELDEKSATGRSRVIFKIAEDIFRNVELEWS